MKSESSSPSHICDYLTHIFTLTDVVCVYLGLSKAAAANRDERGSRVEQVSRGGAGAGGQASSSW